MSTTRNWDDVYSGLDALTPEDRAEIDLRVKIIGEILKARKEQGLSQTELGYATGSTQPAIARLENGGTDPKLSTIIKILSQLGMTLNVVPIHQNIQR